jgi:hypothetical protein
MRNRLFIMWVEPCQAVDNRLRKCSNAADGILVFTPE